jgi:hypothetical protein
MAYMAAMMHQYLIDLTEEKGDDSEKWLINSGATANVTASDKATKSVTRSKRCLKVGNGATCHAAGEGEIIFREDKTGITIKVSTLVVVGFAKNILSVKQLLSMGYGVEAKGEETTIHNREGTMLFTCKQVTECYT